MRPKAKLAKITAKWRMVGLGSLGLITLLTLTLILPSCSKAKAETSNPSVDDTFSASLATNVSTYVRSSIAIGLSKAVEMAVTPQAGGAFSTSTAKLKVTTNNVTGYKVYLTTTDGTSKLNPTNPQVEAAINPVNGTMTSENYKDGHLDTWGYSISNTEAASNEYKAVPQAGAAPVISTNQTSSDDSYTLGFAVATSVDLPAGLYTNSVLASAVANPIEVRSLLDITYMQEMTPEICQVSFENETKQLIDSRDNKSYWVAKLKDGNCWMTQNLGLTFKEFNGKIVPATADGSEGTELTMGNTDISLETWTPTEASRLSPSPATEPNSIVSWDLETGVESIGRQSYYTWNMATAGSGISLAAGKIAISSICPKGWKLPSAVVDYNTASGSFYNLLNGYGLATHTTSAAGEYTVYRPNNASVMYSVEEGQYDITNKPLNFIKSGLVRADREQLEHIGGEGDYWSASAGRHLHFYGSGVSASNSNNRNLGFPVRCLAR